MKTAQQRVLIGGFFLLMGILISMAAFGVGPMSDSQMHAPRWVVGVAGVLFASGSVVLIARVVFGMVAILGAAISANALRRALSGHA